jgi:membrane protein required for colicin V production
VSLIATDYVIMAILALAGMIATAIGFVRLVLGLGGWIGAGLVTLYGFPLVREIPRSWIDSPPLADAAAGGTLFVVSLIALTLVTHGIAQRVRQSGFGALDRSLGLVSGLILGLVLVCATFVVMERVMNWADDPSNRPAWVREANTLPALEFGADLLLSILPEEWGGGRASRRSPLDPATSARRLMTPPRKGDVPQPKSGYNTQERREMNRLIESR